MCVRYLSNFIRSLYSYIFQRQQQQQQRSWDVPTPQQLCEWYTQRQRGGGFGLCTYVLRTGDRAGEQCGGTHTAQRCFRRLTDAWRQQFPKAAEIPRWGELSRAGVAIFDLDFDAILAAMYAVTISDEGDCYRCFSPDPGIGTSALGAGEASALGASASVLSGVGETALSGTRASALSGTASASASLTFTLDSGASRSFFRDRTTLTPLSRPVAVSLADPSGGPVLSRFSTVLPCPAAPSSTLSGLYLPSFSTNLVSGAALQDAGVHQFTPAHQRVTHCTEASTGRHLATFTRQPGSSLSTASPPVPESGRVLSSGQVFAAASRSGPDLRRPVYGLRQAPREWHDTLRTTLAALGFAPSTADPSLFLRTDTSLPPFYILVYVDDLVFATADTAGHTARCEAEIYAGAMAAQELRWLTYLLTDLGEPPRSSPVLYVDNKAMLALCREQRLEHRTKHIALRYFLARELQQRGQLRLAYVASEANTADVFTKALAPCDHLRCCTQLGLLCLALLDWSCDPLFSPTLPMG
ncbi:unnamed protein product, partial [Closterium sp. NIES-53]